MEFIFELIAEIIMEPIVEGYLLAMSHFSDGSKQLDEDKVKAVVVFESVALFLMLVVGGVMLAESSGKSLTGKILLILSVAVSAFQIGLGVILKRMNKKKNLGVKTKISVSHYKKTGKELFVNGGRLYIDGDKLILKSFLRKIAVFSIDEIKCRKLPDELLFKAVEISDNEKSYVLLLLNPNYLKLCEVVIS